MTRADIEEMLRNLAAMARTLAESRRRLRDRFPPEDDNRDGTGVREPVTRDGPFPRLDQIQVRPPAPRYRLNVIGTHGGKVTIETQQ